MQTTSFEPYHEKTCLERYLVGQRQTSLINYRKVPKFSDTRTLCCNLPKIQTICQKDANEIANSEDPDQTAPLGAVWSGLHCLLRPTCPKTYVHYGIWASLRVLIQDLDFIN